MVVCRRHIYACARASVGVMNSALAACEFMWNCCLRWWATHTDTRPNISEHIIPKIDGLFIQSARFIRLPFGISFYWLWCSSFVLMCYFWPPAGQILWVFGVLTYLPSHLWPLIGLSLVLFRDFSKQRAKIDDDCGWRRRTVLEFDGFSVSKRLSYWSGQHFSLCAKENQFPRRKFKFSVAKPSAKSVEPSDEPATKIGNILRAYKYERAERKISSRLIRSIYSAITPYTVYGAIKLAFLVTQFAGAHWAWIQSPLQVGHSSFWRSERADFW